MNSTEEFAGHVVDQLQHLDGLRLHRMFGEYAVYLDDKVIGLICDDQLFYRVTDLGLHALQEAGVAPEYGIPYPRAGEYLLVTFLDDAVLTAQVAISTASALPAARSRSRRASR